MCTKCCTILPCNSHRVSKSPLPLSTSLSVYPGITGNRADKCALTAKGFPSKRHLGFPPWQLTMSNGKREGSWPNTRSCTRAPQCIREWVKEKTQRSTPLKLNRSLIIPLVLTGTIQKKKVWVDNYWLKTNTGILIFILLAYYVTSKITVFEKCILQSTFSFHFIMKWIRTSDFTWLAEMIKLKRHWFIIMTLYCKVKQKEKSARGMQVLIFTQNICSALQGRGITKQGRLTIWQRQ